MQVAAVIVHAIQGFTECFKRSESRLGKPLLKRFETVYI